MGYRQKVLGGRRIELSEGYWAEIRPFDGDEQDQLNEILLGGPVQISLADGKIKDEGRTTDQKAWMRAALPLAIVRWNVDDETGAVLPITAETVLQLSVKDRLLIVNLIKDLNNPLADEQKRLELP